MATPTIVQIAEQQVALIRLTVPRAEIQQVMGPGIGELAAALQAQGIPPTGPWFTHHLHRPTDVFDFEACLPVATPVIPVGRVINGTIAAATVARTVYQGRYEGLAQAWAELESWIVANGHRSAPSLIETYLIGPNASPDSSTWRTQLDRPLVTA
jgi:effector-binding domain-containing protein